MSVQTLHSETRPLGWSFHETQGYMCCSVSRIWPWNTYLVGHVVHVLWLSPCQQSALRLNALCCPHFYKRMCLLGLQNSRKNLWQVFGLNCIIPVFVRYLPLPYPQMTTRVIVLATSSTASAFMVHMNTFNGFKVQLSLHPWVHLHLCLQLSACDEITRILLGTMLDMNGASLSLGLGAVWTKGGLVISEPQHKSWQILPFDCNRMDNTLAEWGRGEDINRLS